MKEKSKKEKICLTAKEILKLRADKANQIKNNEIVKK